MYTLHTCIQTAATQMKQECVVQLGTVIDVYPFLSKTLLIIIGYSIPIRKQAYEKMTRQVVIIVDVTCTSHVLCTSTSPRLP